MSVCDRCGTEGPTPFTHDWTERDKAINKKHLGRPERWCEECEKIFKEYP